MAHRFGVALALVCIAGCQSELGTRDSHRPIIGGDVFTSQYQSVCAMEIVLPPDPDDPKLMRDNLWCGCVLVAPQIVLTAASCVHENLAADTLADVDLRFGADFGSGVAVNVTEAVLHRYFNPEQTGAHDLALLFIDTDPATVDASIVPATLNERALTSADVGTAVTLLGSGEEGNGMEQFGQRKKVEVAISVVTTRHIETGTDDENTACRGDSGAPGFADLGAGEVVVSINARLNSCSASARRTRIDRYLADFIHPYIDRHYGACTADGTCETTGCRTPDPDCDACAWQGPQPPPETPGADCQSGCATRDWDCPIGVFLGGTCTETSDCEEAGRCIAADDDASYTYCTRSCDPAGDATECPSPAVGATMTCVDIGGGVGECVYDTPSPGSQGFACGTDNNLCRSGICEETVCVNECDPAGAACPDGYTCSPSSVSPGSNVCLGQIKSGGGGFCTLQPAGARKKPLAPTLFGLLLLGGIMLGLVWLRKSRQSSVVSRQSST